MPAASRRAARGAVRRRHASSDPVRLGSPCAPARSRGRAGSPAGARGRAPGSPSAGSGATTAAPGAHGAGPPPLGERTSEGPGPLEPGEDGGWEQCARARGGEGGVRVSAVRAEDRAGVQQRVSGARGIFLGFGSESSALELIPPAPIFSSSVLSKCVFFHLHPICFPKRPLLWSRDILGHPDSRERG